MKRVFFTTILLSLLGGFFAFTHFISAQQDLGDRLKGKILLQVEQNGEAWYIHPKKKERFYLGKPQDAFNLMSDFGTGMTNKDFEKIQVADMNLSEGADDDNDGLSNQIEDAFGTDKNKQDTDNDGYSDKEEILAGYSPNGKDKLNIDYGFIENKKGFIYLQVEQNGEAWYINPDDSKRYFLGRPRDAFNLMRVLGLGILDEHLLTIPIHGEKLSDIKLKDYVLVNYPLKQSPAYNQIDNEYCFEEYWDRAGAEDARLVKNQGEIIIHSLLQLISSSENKKPNCGINIKIFSTPSNGKYLYVQSSQIIASDVPYSGLGGIYRLDLSDLSLKKLEVSGFVRSFDLYRGNASDSYKILNNGKRLVKWDMNGVYLVDLENDYKYVLYSDLPGMWLISSIEFSMGQIARYDVKINEDQIMVGLYNENRTQEGHLINIDEHENVVVKSENWNREEDIIRPKFIKHMSISIPRYGEELCTMDPRGIPIGSHVYPIDKKYSSMSFLGQVFTAAECGEERLQKIWGVDGENYTIGSSIILNKEPDQELFDVLKSIGYNCLVKEDSNDKYPKWVELENATLNDKCLQWTLSGTVKTKDLLKLKPYYKEIKGDGCVICG